MDCVVSKLLALTRGVCLQVPCKDSTRPSSHVAHHADQKVLRILHVASFSGNIGDIAQTEGLRHSLNKTFSRKITLVFEPIEIRHFYKSWNEASFGMDFATLANCYDAVIFGGGGFFDMKISSSQTGTTIDMSESVLKSIKVPIIFYAMGCNQMWDPDRECADKFRHFLDALFQRKNCLISVRNDGSLEVIRDFIGQEYSSRIFEIPDPAFFFELHDDFSRTVSALIAPQFRHIALCFAGDYSDLRYGKHSLFAQTMARALETIVQQNDDVRLLFVPHVHCDLEIITQVFSHLPDKTRRLRTQIAPLLHQNSAAQYIYTMYDQCELAISNRFHGVVVPLSMRKKVIAYCDKITKKVPSIVAKMNQKGLIYTHSDDLKGFIDKINANLADGYSSSTDAKIKDLFEENHKFLLAFESILPK